MDKMRREWYLISFGMVVIAGVILINAFRTPDTIVRSIPQTVPTEYIDSDKSRYCVCINEATREELLGVRYISEDMADAIIAYREENGDFLSEEDLLKIYGIGPKTLERIRPYISL